MVKKYEDIVREKYEKLYTGVTIDEDLLAFFIKDDRRIKHFERDSKRERFLRDKKGRAVKDENGQLTYLPEREVSMDKLMREDWEFSNDDLTPEEILISAENADIHEIRRCVGLLNDEERDLITARYFGKMTIRGYADSTPCPNRVWTGFIRRPWRS